MACCFSVDVTDGKDLLSAVGGFACTHVGLTDVCLCMSFKASGKLLILRRRAVTGVHVQKVVCGNRLGEIYS